MTARRGFSLFEMLASCAVIAVLASLLVIPSYIRYTKAREVDDASSILAQDIGYLERFAQDSDPLEGATIEVQSDDPLRYTCYSGRPSLMDPQSHIRDVLIVRDFPNVRIEPGALDHASPLLFARNGSLQYVSGGDWNDQHEAFSIELQSRVEPGRTASLSVDPFTGGVSASN
jgi:prepilin-type N-terminal cleavage/methylation domain-containing protein